MLKDENRNLRKLFSKQQHKHVTLLQRILRLSQVNLEENIIKEINEEIGIDSNVIKSNKELQVEYSNDS